MELWQKGASSGPVRACASPFFFATPGKQTKIQDRAEPNFDENRTRGYHLSLIYHMSMNLPLSLLAFGNYARFPTVKVPDLTQFLICGRHQQFPEIGS
jgi:hypothetical protein